MAKKRSTEREIQRAIELGQKNAEVLPKVRNWCRHLEIKMESAGLVAQFYQLPVGMMHITCPHASAGGSMSMHLTQVAADFITANCRNCPHHELVSLDNIGRSILNKEDEVRMRLDTETKKHSLAKHRLKELVSGDLTEALRREDVTAQSVLKLVLLMDDENHLVEHHVEAAKKLMKAAEIAPEFFTKDAVEVISSHFPDPLHGELCIDTVQLLARLTGVLPEIAFRAAKNCLEKVKNTDKACFLIGNYLQQHDLVPEADLVKRVVYAQWYASNWPNHIYRSYAGGNFALKIIGEKAFDLLSNALLEQLKSESKSIRFNAANVIQALIDGLPELAKQMIDPLIDSLELEDDIDNGISADGAACSTIAAIYVRHPDHTQEKLNEGHRRLSSDAKEEAVRVYRFIVLGGEKLSNHGQEMAVSFESCIPRIVSPLLQIVSGFAYHIDVRAAAAETLETIGKYNPEYLLENLDGLLGAVANLTHESVLFNEKKPRNDLEGLQQQGVQATYSKTTHQVISALKGICKHNPRVMLERLREIVPNLDSSQRHLAIYKAELAALYGELGRNTEFLPEVIPELYKLFLDFGSVSVRSASIDAITKILEKNSGILPQNMVELLIVYLTDRYVYIHKSAVRAMQQLETDSKEDVVRIAQSLQILDENYENEPYFRKEILRALVHVTWEADYLLQRVTAPIVVKQCQIPEFYVAQDALEEFERLLPRLPEKFKTDFAREVISFLGRYERDRFNNEAFTDRYGFLLHLFELPKEAISSNLSGLREASLARAKDDPWDALRLVQLLSYFELHAEAAVLADEIEAAQEKVKRNEAAIRESKILGQASRAEDLIQSGQINEAIKCLEQASKLEAERHARRAVSDPRDFINSLTVANEIADDFE